MNTASEQAAFNSLAALGVFLVIILAVIIFVYVLRAIALYTMAKRQNIANAWLAWVPIGQEYVYGMVLKEKITVTSTLTIPYAQWVLIGLTTLSTMTSKNDILMIIVSIVTIVVTILAWLRLYKLYAPEKAVLYTVLSVIIPIASPIIMMIIRKNTPVEYDFTDIGGSDSNKNDGLTL